MSDPDPPVGLDLRERFRNTAAVLTGCLECRERDDGCAMRFPRTEAWSRRLHRFRAAWKESCPYLSFRLEESADALWLSITGPEGTREWVTGARSILSSSLNPPRDLRYRVRRAARMLTSPLRVLPDFLIIGASKCGTTSLYSYLIDHPCIHAAQQKEVGHFDARCPRSLWWYRSFFPSRVARLRGKTRGAFRTGEATPDYLFHPDGARRVREALPRVRCIALLRDPVDRAYSFYHYNRRAGLESASFEEALDREEERLRPTHPTHEFNHQNFSYMARGRYAEQLRAWCRHFPGKQLLVLTTERLAAAPEESYERVLDFLALPPHRPAGFTRLNVAPYPELSSEIRRKLAEYFAGPNQELRQLLGFDPGWSS